MTKSNKIVIDIPEIKIKSAVVRIVGTSPLVVHKFSEKSKRQMLDKQMKTATAKAKATVAKNPVEDFIRALYWIDENGSEYEPEFEEYTEDAFEKAVSDGAIFGFRAVGIKAASVAAAYRAGITKDKVSANGAFHIDHEFVAIQGVVPIMREDTVRVGMGVADIRFRPEFPAGWYIDLPITYDEGIYTLEQIVNFVNRGGFSVGIGEYRPEKGGSWGRYQVARDK
jgi:hypothetical protein